MTVAFIFVVATLVALPLFAQKPEYPLAGAVLLSLARDLPNAELLSATFTVVAAAQVTLLRYPHMSRDLVTRLAPLTLLGLVMAARLASPSATPFYTQEIGFPSWAIAIGNVILALTTARYCAVPDARFKFGVVLGYVSIFYLVIVVPLSIGDQLRLEGFSGNPNRFALTLALLFPFAYVITARYRNLVPSTILIAWVAFLASLTMSSQGLIVIPLSVLLSMYGLRKIQTGSQPRILKLLGTILAASVTVTYLWATLGQDFLDSANTLAGRDIIFRQAWTVFSAHPIFGTGSRSVIGSDQYLSAHNSYLGILVLGGTIALLPLTIVAFQLVSLVWNWRRVNSIILPLVITLAFQASVQSIDLIPAVWALMAYALSHPTLKKERQHRGQLQREHPQTAT